MSWYNTDGNACEHVLFSKFTYTRNLANTLFSQAIDKKKMSEILALTDALLKKNGFHQKDVSARSILAYYEKQYIEPDVSIAGGERAVYFNEPCSLSLSIGSANLFNVYAILPGASISEAHKLASSVEQLLDSELDFAYSQKAGYLSPIPHLCGSGSRISTALYLPLLKRNDKITSVMASLYSFGAALHPLFSHKSFGDIYIMSYTLPKDRDEASAISLCERLVTDIVALEHEQQSSLSEGELEDISELSHRAIGVLEYATGVTEEEMLELISQIRLSLCLGKALPKDLRPSTLNNMLIESLSAVLCADSRGKITSEKELAARRASVIKKLLRSVPSARTCS